MTNYEIWGLTSGSIKIYEMEERKSQYLVLPINPSINLSELSLKIISGKLPPGLFLDNNLITGTVFEVEKETIFNFTIRATYNNIISDRTFRIDVFGADDPRWLTPSGILPTGPNKKLYILDNAIIDYQLIAVDSDTSAGDILEFFIAPDEGELPPGISLTKDGRLVGITEPLLALDQFSETGFYDTNPYGEFPYDYAPLGGNGYDSFYYDLTFYDDRIPTRSPRKLNRHYRFIVSVSDGDTIEKREFEIYLVGDDFLRADNTIMKASNGVFTGDNTHIRRPVWLTPKDFGYRRANNYVTLYLETINDETLNGRIVYILEDFNDNGTPSELPPGMHLDSTRGRILGRVPYQPAITKKYNFTIKALRFTGDYDPVEVSAKVYEDVLMGNTRFKINKLNQSLDDNVNDLLSLVNRTISLYGRNYTVRRVDSSNSLYDVIELKTTLFPARSLLLSRDVDESNKSIFVSRLSEEDKVFYRNQELRFSDSEVYSITSITPYIKWRILSQNDISIDYTALGIEEEVESFETTLYRIFAKDQGPIFVEKNESREIIFSAPLNDYTSNDSRLNKAFTSNDIIKYEILKNEEDLIEFQENISPSGFLVNKEIGDNFGIALRKNDTFTKNVTSNEEDPIDTPSTRKTFTVNMVGEIDTTINWKTPKDLGEIIANRVSLLKIEAETDSPNKTIQYTLKSGELPPGLKLSPLGYLTGSVNQFATNETVGLTSFDNADLTFDQEETTIDRIYTFKIEARDFFSISATERTFQIKVLAKDKVTYSDIYVGLLMSNENRKTYKEFITDVGIFPPDKMFRLDDSRYGIQMKPQMLIYSGIETTDIEKFVAMTALNHKRKRLLFGDVKTAIASIPGTRDIIYEVVYVEIVDPDQPKQGRTRLSFLSKSKIDDNLLSVNTLRHDKSSLITDKKSEFINTLRANSTAISVSEKNDVKKYISNIPNMRSRIREVGLTERELLPLWMRTPQKIGEPEVDYITAIPLCFCEPGNSKEIISNIKNSNFDFKQLDFVIDRYIIYDINGQKDPYQILFPNFQYNI